jgi:hypothetical protein
MNRRWIAPLAAAAVGIVMFGAAATAQTPSPTTQATATTVAGTRTATTVAGTQTPVITGTVSTQPTVFPTIVVPASLYVAGGAGDFPFAHPAFQRVWTRTDRPVAEGKVSRTWFWGPGPNTPGLIEAYKEGPAGTHLVQYFDKSRMEVNNPAADQSQPFFVTNGLLTVDMIAGSVQVGEAEFAKFHPACIPMSGDFGDTLAPTYASFQNVSVSADRIDTHKAQNRTGQRVTETIDRNGKTGTDASKSTVPGVELVHFETQTNHNIPKVFWDFLNSSGRVYNAQNQLVTEQLIVPWFFASGYPVSEPYWAKARIRGTVMDVMIQAYERRALTYVPTNVPGFQVEMANIGQHYFDWRYRNFGLCAGTAPTTPTPPVPAPTGTVVIGTGTPQVTGTPRAGATGTTTVTRTPTEGPVGTPVPAPTLSSSGSAGR